MAFPSPFAGGTSRTPLTPIRSPFGPAKPPATKSTAPQMRMPKMPTVGRRQFHPTAIHPLSFHLGGIHLGRMGGPGARGGHHVAHMALHVGNVPHLHPAGMGVVPSSMHFTMPHLGMGAFGRAPSSTPYGPVGGGSPMGANMGAPRLGGPNYRGPTPLVH